MTPHHLEYGEDDDSDLTSGCAWCHLDGIHRGRLRADGLAPDLTWVIGREPILIVKGREKIAVDRPAQLRRGVIDSPRVSAFKQH